MSISEMLDVISRIESRLGNSDKELAKDLRNMRTELVSMRQANAAAASIVLHTVNGRMVHVEG